MTDTSPRLSDPAPSGEDLPADGLLLARVLDGAGGARTVDHSEASAWQPGAPGEVLWVHLDRTVAGVEAWLRNKTGIAPATVAVLISNDTRPRAFLEGEALVTVLRGINLNPGSEPEDMVAMQIWSDGTRLISLRRRRLQTPRDIAAQLDAGRGPCSAGDLLAALLEELVAKMNSSIVGMNGRIDELEMAGDEIDDSVALSEITSIRRQCLALQRYMSPQHEAMQQIGRTPPPWLNETNCRDVYETIERLRRYLDDLNVSKESAIVLQDDLNNRAQNQSNRTMYMLSIVAAIFLPLSFITGLLGINVGGMPGVQSSDAFWITVGALTILLLFQIAVFRKIKWL
ncbi:MAG: CorA family divalent cation transporter [Novosphingobium sp.]